MFGGRDWAVIAKSSNFLFLFKIEWERSFGARGTIHYHFTEDLKATLVPLCSVAFFFCRDYVEPSLSLSLSVTVFQEKLLSMTCEIVRTVC